MNARTYGTYAFTPASIPNGRGSWVLDLEPAVRMRARRTFGRIAPNRSNELIITDTLEVARDLAWFMDRFPLLPRTIDAKERLEGGAAEHFQREQAVHRITAGKPTKLRLPKSRTPTKTPRDYQLAAVELLRTTGRLIVGDEVGLGKTFIGLLGLVHQDALPAVIVPPTHLPPRWEKELREAFPFLTFETAKRTTPSARVAAGDLPDVLIVPYSRLDGHAAWLQNLARTVVFDEIQELRSGDETAKGAAAALISENADYVLGLTATPVYNYGGEIWQIYNIIDPGRLGDRDEFTREWGRGLGNGHIAVNDPAALGSYLREQGLLLARTRKEVGRELPKTVKTHMSVDTDDKAMAAIAGDLEKLAQSIVDGFEGDKAAAMKAGGEISWKLRHATGVDKAPYVADWVRLLLQSEERVILWGWHRDVYDIWMDKLADFNPVLYTGSESPRQKLRAEQAFTRPISEDHPIEEASRVFIMSLRSGAGVDGLQEVCRVGVFGELDWSPQIHEQAIGRLRRDGMGEDPPVVYFLTSDQGSDPVLLEVLGVKRQQSEPLMSPNGKLLTNSTSDANRGRLLAQQVLAAAKGQKR